jgi:hypothetical protein
MSIQEIFPYVNWAERNEVCILRELQELDPHRLLDRRHDGRDAGEMAEDVQLHTSLSVCDKELRRKQLDKSVALPAVVFQF